MEAEDTPLQDIPPPEPVAVTEKVRSLLAAVADGWAPDAITFSQVESCTYDGEDISHCAPELTFQGNMLQLTFQADGLLPLGNPSLSDHFAGKTADGTCFRAEVILRTSRSFTWSQDHRPCTSVTLAGASWTLATSEVPVVWVGAVEGAGKVRFSGNLVIERRSPERPFLGLSQHYCFFGTYTYYLVQYRLKDSTRWHILVDTGSNNRPDVEIFGRDMLAIEFALGRQLRVLTLSGVTSDKRTVALTTGYTRRKHLENNSFPPVPLERDNEKWIDASWAPLLFARLSRTWSALPPTNKAYWIAVDMYLDAMQYHLDFDYMRLQIALEAFAFWLLRHKSNGDPVDVKDVKAWEQWVRANKEAIRSHAIEGREDALVQRVKGTYRLASGNVVPTAFAAHGISLSKELRSELRGRDVVVHQGLMAPEGYDANEDLHRVSLVRTMLVALIARSVGYGGAINGSELGELGYHLEQQDWWTVSEDDHAAARQKFLADDSETGGRTSQEVGV